MYFHGISRLHNCVKWILIGESVTTSFIINLPSNLCMNLNWLKGQTSFNVKFHLQQSINTACQEVITFQTSSELPFVSMYAYIMCRIDPSYQHASWNVSTGPEHTLVDKRVVYTCLLVWQQKVHCINFYRLHAVKPAYSAYPIQGTKWLWSLRIYCIQYGQVVLI